MKFLRLYQVISPLLASALLAGAETIPLTQQKNGQTIEVMPIDVTKNQVRFNHQNREFTFPLEQLSPESRQLLEAWHRKRQQKDATANDDINKTIGVPLFGVKSLWQEPAKDVAGRLNWPHESSAKFSSSYRRYPQAAERFVGARPYCCTLYGNENEKAESLSVIFANKGDFNSEAGFGQDHFKKVSPENKVSLTLDDAIKQDIDTISKSLTKTLGEPREQRYGEKEDRRDVLRWDHQDHAFILSEREGEYAHLLIVDSSTADSEGKVDFVKDQDFRDILKVNIKRSENGDVVIDNIPMVNQGPKGYCAPATFERAMRYMRVPADMYLLATLATAQGDGTNTYKLAEEAKRIISSKARRIKELELEEDLDVRLVARYIDKGVPILWQMRSLEPYNELVNRLTRERQQVTDFDDWRSQIIKSAETIIPQLEVDENHHICMIIGYNAKTGEVAVSDSWGPSYALRWVPVDVAKAVTSRGGFVIDL